MITVQVSGAERIGAKLGRAALRASDLESAWKRIAAEIKQDAIRLTPVLSGLLASTIRAGSSRKEATVRVGYANMEPYVKIIHYGGWASGSYGPHYIEGNRFMTNALHMNEAKAEHEVEREIDTILRRVGLK